MRDGMKILDEPRTLNEDEATQRAAEAPEVSIFLPVYNEQPNLRPLHAKLDEALRSLDRTAEIVYVDDGSTDGSLNILREIAEVEAEMRKPFRGPLPRNRSIVEWYRATTPRESR